MNKPFGLTDKIGYMLGDLANDFFFIFASSFLMVFYTNVLGITPGIVGTLFLTARVIDAFTDIGMGRIVDTMPISKSGKFRPWIKYMALPVCIAGILLFVPQVAKLNLSFRIIYVFITYILWGSIFYTSINIPYGSMASAITTDPVQRGQLSTYRSVGAAVAGLLISVIVPLIIYTYDASGNQIILPYRFQVVAIIFGVLAFICYQLCYKMSVERVEIQPAQKKKQTIGKTLKSIILSRSLISIIAAAIVLLLSMLLAQTMNVYLFMDYFKNKGAMSLAGFLNTAITLLLAPFTKTIILKIGKKEASSAALLFASVIYFITFFARITNPWVFCIFVGLGNIGTGIFNLLIWAFITDIIDNRQVETGTRDDGTIYAFYSFARKIGQALAGGLGAWALEIIGYKAATAGQTVVQTAGVVQKIYSVATFAPAICYLIVGLILVFAYPLSKKKVEENTRILNQKRASKKDL